MTEPADALPRTDEVLLVRTDFDDDAAWAAIRDTLAAPSEPDGYVADVVVVEDPAHRGRSAEELCALHPSGGEVPDFFFVADRAAMTGEGHPLLVVPVPEPEPELRPEFRVVAEELYAVEANLTIANMDWEDFSGRADPDGVFRGF